MKTLNKISYEENKLRESMKLEYKELLIINIKYPAFFPLNEFTYINNFYKSLATKYYDYAVSKYYTEAVQRYETSDDPRKRFKYKPESITMDFKVTLLNDKFLSLYIEYKCCSQNKIITQARYSQTWSDNTIFTLNTLFRFDKRFKNYDKTNFYLTEENLVLYDESTEEFFILLEELKIRNINK